MKQVEISNQEKRTMLIYADLVLYQPASVGSFPILNHPQCSDLDTSHTSTAVVPTSSSVGPRCGLVPMTQSYKKNHKLPKSPKNAKMWLWFFGFGWNVLIVLVLDHSIWVPHEVNNTQHGSISCLWTSFPTGTANATSYVLNSREWWLATKRACQWWFRLNPHPCLGLSQNAILKFPVVNHYIPRDYSHRSAMNWGGILQSADIFPS
jgi:hypothetical protein